MIEQKIDEIMNMIENSKFQTHNPHTLRTYFSKVLPQVTVNGMWMEFGIYTGTSIKIISDYANKKNTKVYGFDSFEGLHEFWDQNNPKGSYSLNGQIPNGIVDDGYNNSSESDYYFYKQPTGKIIPWPENVILIKGFFEDTLNQFLIQHKDNIAYLHIDCDLYSSTKTILSQLADKIVPGTIIDFDEICDYPDYRNHEIKAFAEYLLQYNKKINTLCCQRNGYSSCSFIVEN